MADDDVISLSDLLQKKGLSRDSINAGAPDEPPKMDSARSSNVLSLTSLKRLQEADIDPSSVASEDARDNIRLFVGIDEKETQRIKNEGNIGFWENISRKRSSLFGDGATLTELVQNPSVGIGRIKQVIEGKEVYVSLLEPFE